MYTYIYIYRYVDTHTHLRRLRARLLGARAAPGPREDEDLRELPLRDNCIACYAVHMTIYIYNYNIM